MTFEISKAIVEDIISGILTEGEDEAVLEMFLERENRYDLIVANVLQFRLIIKAVAMSLTLRQTASMLTEVKEEIGCTKLGYCTRNTVVKVVRSVCAINFQNIKELLSRSWAFFLAFDCGNKSNQSYLDVRIRLVLCAQIENFYLVAIPLTSAHTGKTIANSMMHALSPLCPSWKKKLISLSTDGASAMTGKHQEAVTIVQKVCNEACKSKIYRSWCGLHQLDLAIKRAIRSLVDEEFIEWITSVTGCLRR